MKINNKNNLTYLLFLLIPVFLFLASDVQAISCRPAPVKYIAICKSDVCSEGFEIKYIRADVGGVCRTRPTVNENPESLKEIFNFASELTGIDISADGIYKIDSNRRCVSNQSPYFRYFTDEFLSKEEREMLIDTFYCLKIVKTNLSKISEEISNLALQSYLLEWKNKEREALQGLIIEQWIMAIVMILVTLVLVGWPWLFFWRKPSERKKLSHWLRVAIPFQIIFAFVLFMLLEGGAFTGPLGVLCMAILVIFSLVILGEILYGVIYKSIKAIIRKFRK